jgi:hypothetical protein
MGMSGLARRFTYQPTTIYAHPLGMFGGSVLLNEGRMRFFLRPSMNRGKNPGAFVEVHTPTY